MSALGDRIRFAREQKGLHQDKLASLVGVSSGKVIWTWEKGSGKPDAEKLVMLCKVLGVSASYMLDYYANDKIELNADEIKLIRKYRMLDAHGKKNTDFILNSECERLTSSATAQKSRYRNIDFYDYPASAGVGMYIDDVIKNTIRIPVNRITEGADYIIPVNGDSMDPTFFSGDRVCVKSQPFVLTGEIGIFMIGGDVYIKEYGNDRLISHNGKYDDIKFGTYDEIYCKGKVLGVLDMNDFLYE
jgi:transcriptional regulator with XRE-family HTH domain